MKTIAYFISGHGFGHGVRSSAVINSIPGEKHIIIFSSLPESFFREEIRRPYELIACKLDCGCIQKDTLNTDIAATMTTYDAINSQRAALIDKYSKLLRGVNADLVLADIPPLAFPIAKRAGIPAVGLANFSWLDIYTPYLSEFPEYKHLLEQITEDYACADSCLSMYPAMSMHGFKKVIPIGLVVRNGGDIRQKLGRSLKLSATNKWCLIYVGNFGLETIKWENLNKYPDWDFLGLYHFKGAPDNYHQISLNDGLRYTDLTVSSNMIFGKLGYGLVSECLHFGKNLCFIPRFGFSEYELLKQEILNHGLGRELTLDQVNNLDFSEEMSLLGRNKALNVPATGIKDIHNILGLSNLA